MSLLNQRNDRGPIENWTNGRSESEIGAMIGSASENALDRGNQIVDRLKQFVVDRPGIAIGSALAAGLLIGYFAKRKRS